MHVVHMWAGSTNACIKMMHFRVARAYFYSDIIYSIYGLLTIKNLLVSPAISRSKAYFICILFPTSSSFSVSVA